MLLLLKDILKIAFTSFLVIFYSLQFSTGIETPPGFSALSPVIDFIYPQFNEKGCKIWDLAGAEGYLNLEDNSLKVNKMTITTFSQENGQPLTDTILESDTALIFTKEHRAESPDPVKVQGNGFQIKGKGWVCDRTINRIIVKQDVQVSFQDSLKKFISSQENLQEKTQ